MSEGWSTIESEPAVFHQLIREFGVSGVSVEELWSLDAESLRVMAPVHGLVFLFKWTAEPDPRPVLNETEGKMFFARQVISNACATQAILSVLLNADGLRDSLGPQLSQFKDFTADFPPDMKGLAIGNSDMIREAHNSFARPEPIIPDEKEASKDDDAFHFISYLPINGALYELDGLKEGPIPLGQCEPPQDWLELVVPHIQERMAHYAEKEVRFNVMAIVGDRLEALQRKAGHLGELRRAAEARMTGGDPGQLVSELPTGHEELQAKMHSLEAELAVVQGEVQEEQDKRRRWADDNIRRRFNYVPLLFNALRLIAEKGKMGPLIERAKTIKAKN